jgi:hypothetical protein
MASETNRSKGMLPPQRTTTYGCSSSVRVIQVDQTSRVPKLDTSKKPPTSLSMQHNAPTIQDAQYLGSGDLTLTNFVLGHMGRDTDGQKFWRRYRGPCPALTEDKANLLLVRFQRPLLLPNNTVEDQPSLTSSASASAASLCPRKIMTQSFTITPRVYVQGYLEEIRREKSKGVFHFARPHGVIRVVKHYRSRTDPHAFPSCKKKDISPTSSTKRPMKDPPSPPPSWWRFDA